MGNPAARTTVWHGGLRSEAREASPAATRHSPPTPELIAASVGHQRVVQATAGIGGVGDGIAAKSDAGLREHREFCQLVVAAGEVVNESAVLLGELSSEPGRSLESVEHHCSTSIGVALFGPGTAGQDEVFRAVDAAMYQAKAAGRNAVRFDEPGASSA